MSAAVIVDARGRLLLVRKAGTSAFMQPGGKPEAGESPAQTLVRELAEEVGLRLDEADLVPLGEFSAPAANEPGFEVVADVFPGAGPLAGNSPHSRRITTRVAIPQPIQICTVSPGSSMKRFMTNPSATSQ